MKTTKKKGFTLIELIVVIAIIGVLAAILVPTMLGYVKKSKISSANSSASSVYKAINSALTELDEEGVDVGGLWILTWDGSKWTGGATADDIKANIGADKRFDKKVANFFEDIKKIKDAKAAIKGGSCVALTVANDSTYTGTYPGGVVTTDTYEAYSGKVDDALKDALILASGGKTAGADKTSKKMTFKDSEGKAMTAPPAGDYATLANAASTKTANNLSKSTPTT